MRSLFIACCVFANITTAYAEPVDYSDPTSHQNRAVPSRQYLDGTRQAAANGQVLKKKSGDFKSPNYDLDISVKSGYRTSELKWSIGGDGISVPNILSELKWEKIHGYEFQPSVEYTQKTGSLKGLTIQASINKSITASGENQDSDYLGNNRTFEFSRSNNSSDAGHAEGFSGSIGYAFDFSRDRKKNIIRFKTLVGYAMQNQNFVMRDGVQTIATDENSVPIPGALGPFDGLRSSYDMELSMPFIAMELESYFYDVHRLKIRGQFSRGTYNGTGHWNLRDDFAQPDSFKQTADGNGFLLGAEYGWEFYPHVQFTLSSNFNYFKASRGDDTTFLSDGTTVTAINGFREAKFQSMDYLAGLNYRF